MRIFKKLKHLENVINEHDIEIQRLKTSNKELYTQLRTIESEQILPRYKKLIGKNVKMWVHHEHIPCTIHFPIHREGKLLDLILDSDGYICATIKGDYQRRITSILENKSCLT